MRMRFSRSLKKRPYFISVPLATYPSSVPPNLNPKHFVALVAGPDRGTAPFAGIRYALACSTEGQRSAMASAFSKVSGLRFHSSGVRFCKSRSAAELEHDQRIRTETAQNFGNRAIQARR